MSPRREAWPSATPEDRLYLFEGLVRHERDVCAALMDAE
jgi:hypothetical protein